jgi:hypothetical protein
MSSSGDDSDWKFKMRIGKVAVVHLNSPVDFGTWHVALRQLVTGYNMADSLLYTVPEDRMASLRKKVEATTQLNIKVKKEEAAKHGSSSSSSSSSSASSASLSSSTTEIKIVDLTEEKDLEAAPPSDESVVLMRSMGISKTQSEFFASSVLFVDTRNSKQESEKAVYFRHEIWNWMEQSLSKGQFKGMIRTISPVFDIHALYNKIVSLANKATLISHSLEVFSISRARIFFNIIPSLSSR